MRVLHIISCLVKADGHSQFCMTLAERMVALGLEQRIFSLPSEDGEPMSDPKGLIRYASGWPIHLFNVSVRLGLDKQLAAVMRNFKPDLVHLHGGWHPVLFLGARLARRMSIPIVLSLHGSLRPVVVEGEGRLKKRLAWRLYQRRLVEMADVIHVSSETEREDLARLGFGQPAVVVPNGVDVEAFGGVADRAGFDQRFPACKGARVVLFMSRLHPLKGLDYLLEAWRRVAGDYPGWRLVIAGPDEKGYGERLKRKVQALGLESRVTFGGPVYGEKKVQVLQNVELFVLPTRSENFGIVVAEALACGVPVITTRGAPWAELQGNEENVNGKLLTVSSRPLSDDGGDVNCKPLTVNNKSLNVSVAQCSETERKQPLTAYGLPLTDFTVNGRCGWWIDIGVEPLTAALKEAMGLTDEERCEMGENGRRLVEERYRWEAVAERMSVVYGEIVKSEE